MTITDTAPSRPALRWHGGKWLLAPWIIAHLPPHRCYVEPFGGAASVLLRKPRSYAEVYNDLDSEAVNLFRVLRRPDDAARLQQLLTLTPFAREEFDAAYEPTPDDVERARRLVIRSFMGFGSDGFRLDAKTGFRSNATRSGTTPAQDWMRYPALLPLLVARLQGVTVENRDALACMAAHDGPDTLHYVDPPYLPATRSVSRRHNAYHHELTAADHARLLADMRGLAGMVVLSGYPDAGYDAALFGWQRVERAALADGARPRTEVLWMNPAAHAGLRGHDLFTPGAKA